MRCDLKVGFACNNRCTFCAQGEKRRGAGKIPVQELIESLERARRPEQGVVFTGGEPTVRKDLAELVFAARALGYHPIQIQTNGRMLAYRDLVQRLVAAGVTEFSPALHGPNAEVHDALTRAEGSFEQAVAGIRNALASGAIVVTNTVVVKQNLEHLRATVELLAELGVRQGQLALVHPVGTAEEHFEELVPSISDAARAMKRAIARARELRFRLVVEAMPPCTLKGYEDAIVEGEIPETTVVDADGELFDFTEWRRDQGKSHGPQCGRCTKRSVCEGPWREYPARFGWAEYEPFIAQSP